MDSGGGGNEIIYNLYIANDNLEIIKKLPFSPKYDFQIFDDYILYFDSSKIYKYDFSNGNIGIVKEFPNSSGFYYLENDYCVISETNDAMESIKAVYNLKNSKRILELTDMREIVVKNHDIYYNTDNKIYKLSFDDLKPIEIYTYNPSENSNMIIISRLTIHEKLFFNATYTHVEGNKQETVNQIISINKDGSDQKIINETKQVME